MEMLSDTYEALSSLSLLEIAQGVIVILLAAAVLSIWRNINLILKILFSPIYNSLKTINQFILKNIENIKHVYMLRVRYSKADINKYPRDPSLLNPQAADFVLLDANYNKIYVLYDKHSLLLLDPVYGSWIRRFKFDDEGISPNEMSIIKFALVKGYIPVFPIKTWYSRRVRIDERYFSTDSKDTSPRVNAMYNEALNHLDANAKWRFFEFRVQNNNSVILDVAVSGYSKKDRLVFLDPNYGDWTSVKILENIGIDGHENSIISYLKSHGNKIVYPMY